ncbi:MAG TPA: serine hydrolase domain-containing protein, partial [Longimicrobiales bacterium]|nr:serine hydrolase domain-containing protein [Longimicrobiales bacterium]
MTGRMVLPLRMAALVLAVLATVMAPPGSLAAQAAPLQGLDAYVEKGIQDWEIPGLALAVVKDGEVIHMRGYGVKSLDTGEPVDENTLFAIGSASKAFTASAVAMLRDEGLLEWDDPANEHLPSLELFDPWATRQLTVRDILTHRSGLSRGDAVWYSTDFNRDETLRRIRYLEPSWGFREQFGYQNLMYLAAGQLVPALTGTSWDAFVEERIFEPLGMERSNPSADSLEGMRNVAAPHSWIDGEVGTIPYKNIDNIGPAGSINSSVAEMVNWLRLHLSDGTFQGQQILSEDAVEEMQTPQMLLRLEGRWRGMSPTSHFMTYGMGWFLNDHHGRLVVQHGGNIDGMHALVGMMPEEDVGLVVLTNITPNYLSYSLMYRVFDAILGEEPVDWSGQLLEWYRDLQ